MSAFALALVSPLRCCVVLRLRLSWLACKTADLPASREACGGDASLVADDAESLKEASKDWSFHEARLLAFRRAPSSRARLVARPAGVLGRTLGVQPNLFKVIYAMVQGTVTPASPSCSGVSCESRRADLPTPAAAPTGWRGARRVFGAGAAPDAPAPLPPKPRAAGRPCFPARW